jgi:hypothetical protein
VHRINGRYRHPVAYYVRMTDVARGFTGHGIVGATYTYQQVEALRREDLEEMEHLTVGLEDETSDEERDTGGRGEDPPHVSFGPTVNIENLNKLPAAPRTPTPTSSRLRDDLVGTTRKGKDKRTPHMWYGLIDVAGARWVFDSLEKSQEYVDTKVFRYARVFERKSEAMAWKEGGANTPLDVQDDPSDPGSDIPPDSGRDFEDSETDRSDHKVGRKPSKPDFYLDDSESDSSTRKGSKKPKRKESQDSKKKSKKKRSKPKRRVRKKAPTPPSSSSEDSSSSSSESDSSEDSEERRKHRRQSKKANRKRAKGKLKPQEKFTGSDPSVGDKKRIFGLSINGREIDASAGPPNMRDKDAAELYCAAVDVTSLPGMFGSSGVGADELYDKAQRTTEMAATLLSTAIGKKAQIHDSLWKTAKRHSMGTIKSVEILFKFVKGVGKAEKPAFEQQENAIQVFMLSRHYDDDTISEYCQSGFLPRLTLASYRYYNNMLSIIRQLAFDHPTFWDQGPARAMLEFHSERLLQIRQNSLTRKALVLQTYVYLRDASAKAYYHESMTESLWDRLAIMAKSHEEVDSGKGGGGAGGGKGDDDKRAVRCSHCRSSKLHVLAKVRPTKQLCPLKDVSQKKAKLVAKAAVEKWEKSPTEGGFKAALAAAIASYKEEEE